MTEVRDGARAIDALRRGWPVTVAGEDGILTLLAVERADDVRLAEFDVEGKADVLLSAERAATLKLTNQRGAATPGQPVVIERSNWLDLPAAIALADPSGDLAHPLQGPYRVRSLAAFDAGGAALSLARLAGLLPAYFVKDGAGGEATVSTAAIRALQDPRELAIVTRAHLPTTASETTEIIAFRGPADAVEHVALLIGSPNGQPPLVRVHSECLTGDALGSLKCDCGPQLDEALRRIADSGWGILLYLRQEGRGIGLVNKLRAYSLQDQGFDTVDANLRLGFAVDARDFGIAARMLDLLDQTRIILLTNNPAKVARLEAAAIEVVERVPLALPSNPHNDRYLAVKRDRTGHFL